MIIECFCCDSNATIRIEGYLEHRYVCSLHAAKLAASLGASPNDINKIREYA